MVIFMTISTDNSWIDFDWRYNLTWYPEVISINSSNKFNATCAIKGSENSGTHRTKVHFTGPAITHAWKSCAFVCFHFFIQRTIWRVSHKHKDNVAVPHAKCATQFVLVCLGNFRVEKPCILPILIAQFKYKCSERTVKWNLWKLMVHIETYCWHIHCYLLAKKGRGKFSSLSCNRYRLNFLTR